MEADLEKLEANLGGVADMKRQPDAVFVIDLKKEQLAVRETHRLGVPVIGLVDTNADPDEANFVIPGNDDAIRSCDLVARVSPTASPPGARRSRRPRWPLPPNLSPSRPRRLWRRPASRAEPELEPAAVAEGR